MNNPETFEEYKAQLEGEVKDREAKVEEATKRLNLAEAAKLNDEYKKAKTQHEKADKKVRELETQKKLAREQVASLFINDATGHWLEAELRYDSYAGKKVTNIRDEVFTAIKAHTKISKMSWKDIREFVDRMIKVSLQEDEQIKDLTQKVQNAVIARNKFEQAISDIDSEFRSAEWSLKRATNELEVAQDALKRVEEKWQAHLDWKQKRAVEDKKEKFIWNYDNARAVAKTVISLTKGVEE